MYVVIHDGRIIAIASSREAADQGANGQPRTILGPFTVLDFAAESLVWRDVKRAVAYGGTAG